MRRVEAAHAYQAGACQKASCWAVRPRQGQAADSGSLEVLAGGDRSVPDKGGCVVDEEEGKGGR
jgi:hypothetical protein